MVKLLMVGQYLVVFMETLTFLEAFRCGEPSGYDMGFSQNVLLVGHAANCLHWRYK